jgi:membrane-associated phospholipid phosphatase
MLRSDDDILPAFCCTAIWIIAIGFAGLLAGGCQELPRSGWSVVRGTAPDFEIETTADAEDSEDTLEVPNGPARLVTPERSVLQFDEDQSLDSLLWNSPAEDVSDEPFGFGMHPPTSESTDESTALETKSDPFRLWPDVKAIPGMLWVDAKSLVTWPNALILGAAGGASVWVRKDLDQRVRNETAEHPLRWGEGSVVLRQFGEYTVQVPVLAGVYAASLWAQDPYLHEFSVATISAYGLSAAATVAIKGITNTQRPTNQFEHGHYGFPSYHASSTFTIAACVEEFYGWKVGLPAYVLAGLVGWSRIDQREHDLSDVLFGAVLGVVIGKTVAAAHLDRQSDLQISPYFDTRNQATGIQVEKRY